MEPLTMILIEDSPIFAGLVAAFLEHTQAGLVTLLGTARSGGEGIRLVETLRPAAAVVDLRLPGMPGLEVVRRLRAGSKHLAVVVLSSADLDVFEAPALDAGADAFIPKDQVNTALVPALRRAVDARGDAVPQGDSTDG